MNNKQTKKATVDAINVMIRHADKGPSGFWVEDHEGCGNPAAFFTPRPPQAIVATTANVRTLTFSILPIKRFIFNISFPSVTTPGEPQCTFPEAYSLQI